MIANERSLYPSPNFKSKLYAVIIGQSTVFKTKPWLRQNSKLSMTKIFSSLV